MARDGRVETGRYDNSYFYVNWQTVNSEEDRNTNNRDIINWQAGIVSGAYWYSNAVKLYGIYINGSQVFGGGTWSNIYQETRQLASGSNIIIPHNPDGTKTFNINFSGWLYSDGDLSASQNFTLDKINRIAITNSVTGSDIDGNFSVNYTKYLDNYTYKLRISIPNVTELERIDNYVSNTEFTLSQASIETLYQRYTTTNLFNLEFAVETWNGTQKLSNGNAKIINARITGANPIFTDFDYNDINPTTLALTGNSKYNVNNYSTIRVSIDTTNKAIAQKGATMVKYQLMIGNITKEVLYSDSDTVNIDIPNSNIGEYKVYAIDSRNNATLVTKLALQNINYEPIFIDYNTSSVERTNDGLGDNIELTYNGTIWNNSFGYENNSITLTSYQYQEVGSNTWITPSNPTVITPTITNNTFTFTGQIRSDETGYTFDLSKSYLIKIIVQDELSSYELILNPVPSGIPNISLNKNGVGIMCDYDETLGGLLQVGGEVYGANDVYSTNETLTNKIWIDDKPIYRMVIEFTGLTIGNAYTKTLANCGINNVDSIIKLEGYEYSSGWFIPLSEYNTFNNYLFITNSNLAYKCGWADNIKIIIEYTKTSN